MKENGLLRKGGNGMTYKCKCDTCGHITIVETDVVPIGPNYSTYVTCYGYLRTKCINCGESAYAVWHGLDGKRLPNTGLFC